MALATTSLSSPLGSTSRLGHAAKQPRVSIRPATRSIDLNVGALWEYRGLLYFLIWRDVKVRYKQTAIGAGWAIIQPLMTMMIFTVVFSKLAKISSNGVPYPIFAFCALLPVTYFGQALSRSGNSLVSDANLITKVYFPRLIIPIAAVISPLVDFAVAFVLLLVMLVWFRTTPTWGMLALPLFVLLSVATALAMSLWLSALCVKYRDVAMVIPFVVQIWMYLSPVAYPSSLVPERWRTIYGLNPMAGVIDGFRWALLGTERPDLGVLGVSTAMVLTVLLTGALYFKQTERTFADLV